MPEVTSHPQGTPSWVELSTIDDQAALAFYGALFGWVDDPHEIGPDMFYHMQMLNGLEAAAIYQQSELERSHNVPPHWRTYFTVDNVDQSAEKAKELDGTLVMEPMDVFDAGRMTMIQDPQGAIFALWQPKEHIGFRVNGESGANMWSELLTTAPEDATKFYSGLLGLNSSKMPGPMDYTMLNVAETGVAGVMAINSEMGPIPPNWTVYFGVDNVDAAIKKAESLGGSTVVPAMDIPEIGRFAGLQDSQGAMFSVFQPAG